MFKQCINVHITFEINLNDPTVSKLSCHVGTTALNLRSFAADFASKSRRPCGGKFIWKISIFRSRFLRWRQCAFTYCANLLDMFCSTFRVVRWVHRMWAWGIRFWYSGTVHVPQCVAFFVPWKKIKKKGKMSINSVNTSR